MNMPNDGRPDSSVNPGGDFQLAESFGLLISQQETLTRAIQNLTTVTERTASAEARYSIQSSLRQPQISQQAMTMMQMGGGVQGLGGGTNQITRTGALSSLQNLQAFGAQRLGTWLYGGGLFTQPGGSGGPGSTPVGTPNSTAAPAGSGAQAAAAAAATSSGGAGLGGGGGGAAPPAGPPGQQPPPLGGAPGQIFGPGGPQTPRGQQGLAMMQLLGARVAMSGGSSGGILNAVKGIPGLGLAVDLYNKGQSIFQSQYQPGRYYQEIEGQNAWSGQAERFHQGVYQASMAFTPLGATAAGQAFNNVTQLGYNNQAGSAQAQFGGTGPYGQNRQGALNFIYHQYTATGATVDQSTQILETASQNSVIQLNQVATALDNLSNVAGKAGTNANTARQQFQQYFQVAVGQGAAAGAPALAGAVAQTQASYGQTFAGTSFAGELGQARQYLLAGQYGLTPGQTQYLQRTAPNQYASMLAGANLNDIMTELGIPQDAMNDLQQRIQNAGGAGGVKLQPDIVNQIATAWLNQWQPIYNFNVDIWAQELTALTGIQLTPANVVQWIVQQVSGNNEAANSTVRTQSTTAGASVSTRAAASATAGGAPTGRFGLAQATSTMPVSGRAGALGLTTPGQSWQQVLTSHGGGVASAYLNEEKQTGQRSPVLESLLQNINRGAQVQVQTKTGPRVMSFEDAMKYYPDELIAGNVMFFNANGTKMLGTTSNITHGLVDPSESTTAEQQQSAGSHLGVSQKAWQKSHPGAYAQATTGSGVTVSLSKEAQQLLKLLPSNSDQASAQATAPAPPWPSVSSR